MELLHQRKDPVWVPLQTIHSGSLILSRWTNFSGTKMTCYDLGNLDQVSSSPSPHLYTATSTSPNRFGFFVIFRTIFLFSSKDASTVTGIHIHEFDFLVFLFTIKTRWSQWKNLSQPFLLLGKALKWCLPKHGTFVALSFAWNKNWEMVNSDCSINQRFICF